MAILVEPPSIWVFRIMVTGVPACDGGEVHHMEGRGNHVLIRQRMSPRENTDGVVCNFNELTTKN